ncbi:MAG: hypothetical protein KAR38_11890, partial [Calditrichia bacterium]|nr:hypothetical protein [Calditrichia bacterium]
EKEEKEKRSFSKEKDIYPAAGFILSHIPFKKHFYTSQWNLLKYKDDKFDFSINPQLRLVKYKQEKPVSQNELHFSNGFEVKGSFNEKIKFYWNLLDNTFNGDIVQNVGNYEKNSGYSFISRNENSINWNENIFYTSLDIYGANVQIGRNFLKWGPGERDNIILSTNAPAFDQLKIRFQSKKIQYTIIAGSLINVEEGVFSFKEADKIKKSIAAQRINLSFVNWLSFSINQMIIYGNRDLEPGYSLPFSFFKSSEHLYGDRDNGLLAADITIKPFKKVMIYGTWLLDDITTGKLGTDFYGNKFGFQTGIKLYDLFLNDNKMVVEYIRLKPYVYTHKLGDFNEYKNYDSPLGSFLQPNSDMVYMMTDKYLPFNLKLTAEYEYIRHGENTDINWGGDIDTPHKYGDPENSPFLAGKRVYSSRYFLTAQWEYFYRSHLFFTFMQEKITGEKKKNAFWAGLTFNFGYRPYKPVYRF